MALPQGQRDVKWAEEVERPRDPDTLARRLNHAIIGSGFDARTAEKVMPRIREALAAGKPVYPIFHHEKKVKACQDVWERRKKLFETLPKGQSEVNKLFDWIQDEKIGFAKGPVLRYQVARDFGYDVAKPDRMLERIAERAGEKGKDRVQTLCKRLAKVSGDRVGVVDMVLWYAGSYGIIPGISRRSARMRGQCRNGAQA